jgi:exopolysaccharide production protein ExoZ
MPAIRSANMNQAASVKHLQDGPTARSTYRFVQVLRAVAAIMVVLHHSTILLRERDGIGHNWINGASGVDIFFVISGFVMTLSSAPLLNVRHPARIFLARRIERIVPLYWLVTTIKVVTVLAVPAVAINALGTPWHIFSSYFMLPSAGYEPVILAGWTLNFEMAFYVLFAIALATRLSLLKVIAPVLLVVAFLAGMSPHRDSHTLPFYANTMVLEFLFGILLAKTLPHARRLSQPVACLFIIIGFLVLLLWAYPNFTLYRGILWGVPALAIVWAAIALEYRWGYLAPGWMLELGDASYSIYLTHGLVLPVVGMAMVHGTTRSDPVRWAILFAIVVLCVISGELTYRFIELPITRWFKGRRKTAIHAHA